MAHVRGFGVVKGAVAGYGADRVALLAAALAFSAAFALAPLMVIVIEIGAALLGGNGHHNQVRNAILAHLQPAIGKDGAALIASIVQATFNRQSSGVFAKIFAWAFFVIAATGFLGAIQAALDEIWHTTERPGFLQTLLMRLKSFAIIAGASIVVVAMVGASTFFDSLGGHIFGLIGSIVLMMIVSTGLFAVLYKWLPRTRVGWRDVLGGAAVTAVLSVGGQYAIGIYLSRASTTSIYGAAGSFAAILLWLYYSATIFLIGAELIKAYATPQA